MAGDVEGENKVTLVLFYLGLCVAEISMILVAGLPCFVADTIVLVCCIP